MASNERRHGAAWTVCGLLNCALVNATVALMAACGTASADAEPVSAVAEAFLADQRAGAWLAAFGRLHAGMQQRCGSGEQLRDLVDQAGAQPMHWILRPPQVRRYTAQVTGEVRAADGTSNPVALSFDRVGDAWAITAWSNANREVCP